MKLKLQKVAIGAVITGVSVLAVHKLFKQSRLIRGVNEDKSINDNTYRFSHQYPEPGQKVELSTVNSSASYMYPVSEEHFVDEDKPRTLSKN